MFVTKIARGKVFVIPVVTVQATRIDSFPSCVFQNKPPPPPMAGLSRMETLTVTFAFAMMLPIESLATAWYLIACGTWAKSSEEKKERKAERRRGLIIPKYKNVFGFSFLAKCC